jgi:hypothetical protein
VTGLVSGDLLKASTDPAREACPAEGSGVELAQGLVVEVILEMLKGESVLKNGGI